jgi:hypothetical protein
MKYYDELRLISVYVAANTMPYMHILHSLLILLLDSTYLKMTPFYHAFYSLQFAFFF